MIDESLNEQKINPIPTPQPEIGIDTNFELGEYILGSVDQEEATKSLNQSLIESLTTNAQTREQIYEILDNMRQDDAVASVMDQYVSDICRTNDAGEVFRAESSNPEIEKYINWTLRSIGVDEIAESMAYDIIAYGDCFIRLPRNSELAINQVKSTSDRALNENILLNVTNKQLDHYAGIIEKVDNPGEMYDLRQNGKCAGFIKVPLSVYSVKGDAVFNMQNPNYYRMTYNRDTNIYDPSAFAHGYLNPTSQRQPEMIELFNNATSETDPERLIGVYKIQKGQSMLYNAFKAWRELNLLEMSALLNRLTQSSVIRIITVNVGDMSKSKVEAFLHRLKTKIEQHIAIDANASMQDYSSAGPVINTIYVPIKDNQGQINVQSLGGDFDPKSLVDIEYFRDKFYGAMGAPKQFFGHTGDGAGFNGGTALTVLSEQYNNRVQKYQRILSNLVTDIVNLFLIDRGLSNYINKFRIKMQKPASQSDIDAQTRSDNKLRYIGDFMNQLNDIDDPILKLKIFKSFVSDIVGSTTVSELLGEYISAKETEQAKESSNNKSNNAENNNERESESTDLLDQEDIELPSMDDIQSNESLDLDDVTELLDLNEDNSKDNYLPTPDELGIGIDNGKE